MWKNASFITSCDVGASRRSVTKAKLATIEILHQVALTCKWMNWILFLQIVQIFARLYLKGIVFHIDAIIVNGVKGKQYLMANFHWSFSWTKA